MSNFFDNFLNSDNELIELKPALEDLENWGKKFWKIDSKEAAAIFAQRGYEDKGCGHIERIISNVEDLLEKYCEVLFQLNHPGNDNNREFKNELFAHLKPTLIMFYIVAHLHDIGINLAGIFEALKKLVSAGGDNALHISEIIYNYHHYASFIVLLELIDLNNNNTGNNTLNAEQCPYLSNIPGKQSKIINDIKKLKEILTAIYSGNNFNGYFKEHIKKEKEFFVILAILCLLHKEVNLDYVRSILRKFKHEKHQYTIKYFNKWWSFFSQAREWTEKIREGATESRDINKRLEDGRQFLLKPQNISNDPGILDLLLVEALLQYGDKTEITIARLARKLEGSKKPGNPLQNFVKDTQYDNQKGFICTDMAKRIISPFARFRAGRFIPVILVDVKNKVIDNQGKLEIIIHHLRFDHDEEIFRILRYHNEKDFYDLGFLEVIKTHIPLLFDHIGDTFAKNPILDIKFKKKEHRILSLEEELKRRLCHFMKTAKKQQKVIRLKIDSKGKKESQSKILETEPKKLFVDFFKPGNVKEIVKCAVNSKFEKLKGNLLKEKLGGELKNHIENLKTRLDGDKAEKEQQSSTLDDELEDLFKEYFNFKNLSDILDKITKESNQDKEATEHLMASIYFELNIQLINFLASLKDDKTNGSTEDSQSRLFVDQDDDLRNKLKSFKENKLKNFTKTEEGIEILRETIYIESMKKINPKDRFPYTAQNREAIFQYSRAILDPEERKKTEGIKKVFYETCDLIVPSSFETMAILNLFYEEE